MKFYNLINQNFKDLRKLICTIFTELTSKEINFIICGYEHKMNVFEFY